MQDKIESSLCKMAQLRLPFIEDIYEKDSNLREAAEKMIHLLNMTDLLRDFNLNIINCSDDYNLLMTPISERQKAIIEKIESVGDKLVWHVITGKYQYPQVERQMETYLIVGENYPQPRRIQNSLLVNDYTLYLDNGKGSFGDAIILPYKGVLKRIA